VSTYGINVRGNRLLEFHLASPLPGFTTSPTFNLKNRLFAANRRAPLKGAYGPIVSQVTHKGTNLKQFSSEVTFR